MFLTLPLHILCSYTRGRKMHGSLSLTLQTYSHGSTYTLTHSSPDLKKPTLADWLGAPRKRPFMSAPFWTLRVGARFYHDPSFLSHLRCPVGSLVDGYTDGAQIHRNMVSVFSVTSDLAEAPKSISASRKYYQIYLRKYYQQRDRHPRKTVNKFLQRKKCFWFSIIHSNNSDWILQEYEQTKQRVRNNEGSQKLCLQEAGDGA